MNKRNTILIAVILMMSVILGACQGGGAASSEEKGTINLPDTQFQTIWINNAIVGYLLENGLDYQVEITQMGTPMAQQSLENGEIDVWLEMWRFNLIDWYNEVIEDGSVIDVGDVYETSTQGWYVPRYVIEGDAERGIEPMAPDLKSVSDLSKYWELFEDPEDPNKGLFTNSITGWQCTEVNKVKLHAYDLDQYYNTIEPGTSAAEDATIAGAIKKGDPIVFYYWEPTWLIGMYDVVQLEEPPYTAECWAEIEKSMGDNPEVPLEDVQSSAGCGYQEFDIHMGVNAEFAESHPDVVEFLEKVTIGTDPLNKTSAFMTKGETTADEAALWYFENYEDTWKTWLTEEQYNKVKESLEAAG